MKGASRTPRFIASGDLAYLLPINASADGWNYDENVMIHQDTTCDVVLVLSIKPGTYTHVLTSIYVPAKMHILASFRWLL